jgi:hypothetical protein
MSSDPMSSHEFILYQTKTNSSCLFCLFLICTDTTKSMIMRSFAPLFFKCGRSVDWQKTIGRARRMQSRDPGGASEAGLARPQSSSAVRRVGLARDFFFWIDQIWKGVHYCAAWLCDLDIDLDTRRSERKKTTNPIQTFSTSFLLCWFWSLTRDHSQCCWR